MVCDSGSVLKNDGMATGAQVDNSRLDSSPGEKLGLFIFLKDILSRWQTV